MCARHLLLMRSSIWRHFHLLALVNCAALNTETQYLKTPRSVRLGVYLEVELLDHMVILFL